MPALPGGDNYGLPGWLLSVDAWELELEVDVWSVNRMSMFQSRT